MEQRPAEGGGEAELVELDFAPPFKRVSMLSELERLLGAPGLSDVVLAAQRAEQRAVAAGELEPRRPGERPGEQHEDANAAEAVRAAEALLSSCCDRAHVSCPAPRTVPRLLDRLTSELIERRATSPVFICDQPLSLSPLAKEHSDQAQGDFFIDRLHFVTTCLRSQFDLPPYQ